jgi:hypothetical protein
MWSALGIAYITVFVLACHFLRRHVRDLRVLPKQIADFSITNAHCFCCSVNHSMPGTGEQLPCDREIVYNTVGDWFGDKNDDEAYNKQGVVSRSISNDSYGCIAHTLSNASTTTQTNLNIFDEKLREVFGEHVLRSMGPTRFGYMVVINSCQPAFWRTWDIASATGTISADYHIKTVLLYVSIIFCHAPAGIKIIFHVLVGLDKIFGIRANRIQDFAVTCFAAVLCILFGTLPLTLMNVAFYMDIAIYLGACGLSILCTMLLYPENFPALEHLQLKLSACLATHTTLFRRRGSKINGLSQVVPIASGASKT